MSITTDLGQGWIAIHDGDYKGDVTLRQLAPKRKKPLQEVTIPATVLLEFAGEVIRSEAIQRLEQAPLEELLHGPSAALRSRLDQRESDD